MSVKMMLIKRQLFMIIIQRMSKMLSQRSGRVDIMLLRIAIN